MSSSQQTGLHHENDLKDTISPLHFQELNLMLKALQKIRHLGLYSCKSDPGAKVIPSPNLSMQNSKIDPKMSKTDPTLKHGTDQGWSVKLIRLLL